MCLLKRKNTTLVEKIYISFFFFSFLAGKKTRTMAENVRDQIGERERPWSFFFCFDSFCCFVFLKRDLDVKGNIKPRHFESIVSFLLFSSYPTTERKKTKQQTTTISGPSNSVTIALDKWRGKKNLVSPCYYADWMTHTTVHAHNNRDNNSFDTENGGHWSRFFFCCCSVVVFLYFSDPLFFGGKGHNCHTATTPKWLLLKYP